MNQAAHHKRVSFVRAIADDCLRNMHVRGKHYDVLSPMATLRRPNTLPTQTKIEELEIT